MNRRRARIFGLLIAAAALVLALSLLVGAQTTSAQGPDSGRGHHGAGRGVHTQTQAQTQVQIDPACCDPAGQGYSAAQRINRRGSGVAQVQGSFSRLPAAVPGPVPTGVSAAMEAGWLDEQHAYRMYQSIIDQFGAVAPFANIRAAKAQHLAAHEAMFARYGLDVPAPAATIDVPVFASFSEACAAAVKAESATLDRYNQWLAVVQDYPDLTQVFTALRDASLNQHLPALERCAGLR